MKDSIIQKEKRCYVCGTTYGLHRHHVYYGTGNRKQSEANGLTVWLCGYHHNMSNNGVHFNRELDLDIKRAGQIAYEKEHTREEFIKAFGRNYLQ